MFQSLIHQGVIPTHCLNNLWRVRKEKFQSLIHQGVIPTGQRLEMYATILEFQSLIHQGVIPTNTIAQIAAAIAGSFNPLFIRG